MRARYLAVTVTSSMAILAALIVLAHPAEASTRERYVALGDSYASGQGAGDYVDDSDTCHRSKHAYPALLKAARSLASYTSVACSGATTASVVSDQISALSATTTLVSVTVGGNDIGFSTIMRTCVLRGSDACVDAVATAEEKVRSDLPQALDTLYDAISQRASRARVIVLGYPVFYELNSWCVGLGETAHSKLNEGINLLDEVIASEAKRHGFIFADVRSAFVGHQLCSGDKWLHALNITSLEVSYHPMASGQSGGYFPALAAVLS